MNTRSLFRKLRKHPSSSSENYLGNLEKSPNQTEPPNPETGTDPDLYFLSLVDPAPALPPSYENQLAITAGPVYYDYSLFGKEQLPSYTPSVYKLTILSVKPELKTPFEKARTRYWSKYVVELNSTQLNLYTYNSSDILKQGHKFNESQINPSDYNSKFTQIDELERVRIFKRKGLLDNDRVVRSYSLQYGKVGLATDYEQKLFVLRVRLETQQFLIDFSDAKQMIYWYHALCAGIDSSLDLTRRTMPIYSSVPYRRWDAQVHGGTVTTPSESSNINHSHIKRDDLANTTANMGISSTTSHESFATVHPEIRSNASDLFSESILSSSSEISSYCHESRRRSTSYIRENLDPISEDDSDESIDDFSELTERDRIFNMIRCISPLVNDEPWEGNYIVKAAVHDYNLDGKAIKKWKVPRDSWKRKQKLLQEYFVAINGLIANINIPR